MVVVKIYVCMHKGVVIPGLGVSRESCAASERGTTRYKGIIISLNDGRVNVRNRMEALVAR